MVIIGGQTFNVKTPFGDVLFGNGNKFGDSKEGFFLDNVIATYLHGPLLSKNPELTDYIIKYCLDRKYNEDKGIWIKTSDVKDFILYYRKVWSETRKFKKELFDKWNGKCYYTDQILLTDKKLYNDPLYRTIDHKISIYNGYKNKIDFREIGNISNLCICSRKSNIHKNINNEVDYKIII